MYSKRQHTSKLSLVDYITASCLIFNTHQVHIIAILHHWCHSHTCWLILLNTHNTKYCYFELLKQNADFQNGCTMNSRNWTTIQIAVHADKYSWPTYQTPTFSRGLTSTDWICGCPMTTLLHFCSVAKCTIAGGMGHVCNAVLALMNMVMAFARTTGIMQVEYVLLDAFKDHRKRSDIRHVLWLFHVHMLHCLLFHRLQEITGGIEIFSTVCTCGDICNWEICYKYALLLGGTNGKHFLVQKVNQ